MNKKQPEAMRLAEELCEAIAEHPEPTALEAQAAAELPTQHARITELESQLAQRFDPTGLLDLIEAYAETAAALQAVKDALAAGQATAARPDDMGRKSIDMVLHCPKCGLQHIDKDNYEELRIEAAELGVDREGERELERWIEEREWPNPPHRSHLCQNRKCGHIWRPADVPTNGVAAIKTAGTKDGPITSPSVEFQILKAEHDNLKSSYGRLKLAYDAWHEKTNWIHKTIKPAELGQHIADVMTARLLCLGDGPKPLTRNPNEL